MSKITILFQKYRRQILYLFFGGCTTLVNIVVYFLCYKICGIPNVPANILAWVFAVLFAFVTNKIWVFESRSLSFAVLLKECAAFFAARILTGLLDIGIMFATVDHFHRSALIWKVISNIIVIIFNYIASKRFIFKKKG